MFENLGGATAPLPPCCRRLCSLRNFMFIQAKDILRGDELYYMGLL